MIKTSYRTGEFDEVNYGGVCWAYGGEKQFNLNAYRLLSFASTLHVPPLSDGSALCEWLIRYKYSEKERKAIN